MTTSEVSPVHDAVIVCVKRIFADVTATSSAHRSVLPAVFAMMQRFVMFAAHAPVSPFAKEPPPQTVDLRELGYILVDPDCQGDLAFHRHA